MQYQSWRKHRDGCVFFQNTQASVFGTGHASFTTSPDGSENYIVVCCSESIYLPSRTFQRRPWWSLDQGLPLALRYQKERAERDRVTCLQVKDNCN